MKKYNKAFVLTGDKRAWQTCLSCQLPTMSPSTQCGRYISRVLMLICLMLLPLNAATPSAEGNIEKFWKMFNSNSLKFKKLTSAKDPLYTKLLNELHKVNPGLYIEFSNSTKISELIITADGNKKLFKLADKVCSQAPKINGWKIISLKPKLGLPVNMKWESYSAKTKGIVFDPLFSKKSKNLGLRIIIPHLKKEDHVNAKHAILRVLDHALGERVFASKIEYVEVITPKEKEDLTNYIPLNEVDKYVEWYVKKYEQE